jgi:HAD superfamily hydrolase (TIGR01458 family)
LTAFFIDIDGVLRKGERAIAGAPEAIRLLRETYPILLVTNTTRFSADEIFAALVGMGFSIRREEVFTPIDATISYIKYRTPAARCHLIMEGKVRADFLDAGLILTDEAPDFVVLGLDTGLSYAGLDRAFRNLKAGAKLIAANATRFYPLEDGLHLGVGPFAKALETASGQEAVVVGKPNPEFFRAALERLRVEKTETVMIGDDPFDDIQGAKNFGLRTVFIEGTWTKKELEKNSIQPDFILSTMAEIGRIIDRLK